MRTLPALVFIAGAAILAVALMRMRTIADGRVLAADRLEESRKDGVAAMVCDPDVPIGRTGAVFTCTATLIDGSTQVLEYRLHPEGDLEVEPHAPMRARPRDTPRNIAPRDPWGERP